MSRKSLRVVKEELLITRLIVVAPVEEQALPLDFLHLIAAENPSSRRKNRCDDVIQFILENKRANAFVAAALLLVVEGNLHDGVRNTILIGPSSH